MTIKQILLGGGGILLILLTLLEITPIKVNPWRWIARAFGRALTADILSELETIKTAQKANATRLDQHIRADDERTADMHRARILQFNNELLRGIPHTREDFIEILTEIDCYERFCREHENYSNNRATHAIKNIERVYDDRLVKRDFLQM